MYTEVVENQISTLVFDWGNTLMKVFPQYQGSMLSWPKVEAVGGVFEALDRLKQRYQLVVATNASDSDSSQVKAALDRIDLGRYFDHIFTTKELGGRKPELTFFRSIERSLDERSYNLIMIGDNYFDDVLGAHRAGWNTIWLNHKKGVCAGLKPIHNFEIINMADLPAILSRINLPDIDTCYYWILHQGLTPNLWMHVQMVATISYLLAVWMRSQGILVDPVLAHRGGLLHDIAKISAKKVGEERDHGLVGAELLDKMDQPILAEIVRRHPLFCLLDEQREPISWEQKIVYFADKLVDGYALVDIKERLAALRIRYPDDEERISYFSPYLERLQLEICETINIQPTDLFNRIKAGIDNWDIN